MFVLLGATGRRLSELPGADEGTEDGVADDEEEEHGGYEDDDEEEAHGEQQAVGDDEDDYEDEESSSSTTTISMSSSGSSRWQHYGSSVLAAVAQPEGRLEVRRVWTAEQLRPHLPAVLAATVHEMVQYATLPAQHHEVRMVSSKWQGEQGAGQQGQRRAGV